MDKLNDDFVNNIWEDANFKPSKSTIKQTGEAIKKDGIRKLNKDNFIVAHCKECNCEMSISTNYNGEFPLCFRHRNPNDRN